MHCGAERRLLNNGDREFCVFRATQICYLHICTGTMLHCREKSANLNPESKRNLPSLHRYSQYCQLDCQIHPVIREDVVRNLDLVAECSWQMHVTLVWLWDEFNIFLVHCSMNLNRV